LNPEPQQSNYRRTAFEFSLIGGDNVVRAFNELMQYMFRSANDTGAKADVKELVRVWGQFLLEIRKSIGEPNTSLSSTDMLRGMITDIDALLKS
jgi:hypothetical protein